MARRAAVYPQVDPRAGGIVDRAVTSAGARARVGEALDRARQRDAAAVRAGERWILREDLARAAALGLADLPARALARPLPVVPAGATEVTVRRHLAAGAPLVIVADRRSAAAVAPLGTDALLVTGGRRLSQMPAAVREVLTTVGQAAGRAGARAWLVGGVVRDVLGGRADAPRDLDVVVEGDGLAVARALAAALGGVAIEHERFLTASVRAADRRIDVATARAERYDVRGALGGIRVADELEDLRRVGQVGRAIGVELGALVQIVIAHGHAEAGLRDVDDVARRVGRIGRDVDADRARVIDVAEQRDDVALRSRGGIARPRARSVQGASAP